MKTRIALLYHGDREARQKALTGNVRFPDLAKAFEARNIQAELVVYHDDFCDEVRNQLISMDGVLVWVNPIEKEKDRSVLDAMLRDVASSGVFVSTHPDVILMLGTKEVLFTTQKIGWGCDTFIYRSSDDLMKELPKRLLSGKARVLKQYRGNGGNGVWKVQLAEPEQRAGPAEPKLPNTNTMVLARHAKRGCTEEKITLGELNERFTSYFKDGGRMIDQEYQTRLPEGMTRCYLVQNKVVGFGHQAINALYPAPADQPASAAPQPGPRLYYPADKPEHQCVKSKLENECLPEMQRLLNLETERLPIIWDCDFLLGPKDKAGADTYVLCEINVSCVSPYPESAVDPLVRATEAMVKASQVTKK